MSRIFTTLAVISTALLIVALAWGMRIGPYNESYAAFLVAQASLRELPRGSDQDQVEALRATLSRHYDEMEVPRSRARGHMLIGILASLVAILVNSISVTYFIGTSRWCKEVVETYSLDPTFSQRSNRVKRTTFPWSLSGILAVLLIIGLGGAADPGTFRPTTPQWVEPHLYAAWFGTTWIAVAFMFQALNLRRNSDIIDEVVETVHQIRVERGLDAE